MIAMKKSNKIKNKFLGWLNNDKDLLENLEQQHEDVHKIRETKDKDAMWRTDHKPIPEVERMEIRSFGRFYVVLSIILAILMIGTLVMTISYLPPYGSVENPVNNEVSERYIENGMEETGAVNIVAGMILDYRAFDTLGESNVLFTAVCAVLILLRMDDKEENKKRLKQFEKEEALFDLTSDPILSTIVKILFPFILLFGIYVVLNGHLSPGGGFSGGAIMGAGLVLYSLAFGFEKIERFLNEKSMKVIVVCSLSFYCLAKSYSFFTGANHLESIISTGTPGNIISAGLILPLNIAVGLIVACTMYGFYSLFKRGRI